MSCSCVSRYLFFFSSPSNTYKDGKKYKVVVETPFQVSASRFLFVVPLIQTFRRGKTTRTTKKKTAPRGYVYIDDEADDSDEGVLVEAEDKEEEAYDMVAHESDVEFIDDRDPETLSVGSSTGYKSSGGVLDAIERKLNAKKRSPSPVKKRSAGNGAVETGGSSGEEDLIAMDADDSALPKPIGTRSSASRRELPKDDPPPFVIRKKVKKSSTIPDPALNMDDETMEKFKSWMAVMSKTAEEPATKAPGRVTARKVGNDAGPSTQFYRNVSPDWDLPDTLIESINERKATGGKRKRSAMGSQADTDSDSRRPSKSSIARKLDFKLNEEDGGSKARPEGSGAAAPMGSPFELVSDDESPSTVFLEDIETYKAYFDPRAPCGVNDPDLQDPQLVDSYSGLPPLPNSYGALTFKEAEPNFINPSRVSPLRLSRQASPGSSPTYRLLVGTRIALCVTSVFCSESVLAEPAKIGAKSDRVRKWLSGVFHNQEWERFEALCCLVFGETVMYGQISSKKAVAFQTMISPDSSGGTKGDVDHRFDTEAPADMFSPIVAKTKSQKKPNAPKPKFKSKTLLAHNDVVPVYDARKQVVDFQTDLGRLDEVLPRLSGEIPFGSFVVVGYTLSSYQGVRSGSSDKVAHLGCNIVWAIVCGTPVLRR
ncbi:hypothetical protein DFH06DRAFT_1137488 [Mycena polygramma]|nr:hypothetical protein DFH06DRAFT_1137488 [Mycena polygramma]